MGIVLDMQTTTREYYLKVVIGSNWLEFGLQRSKCIQLTADDVEALGYE